MDENSTLSLKIANCTVVVLTVVLIILLYCFYLMQDKFTGAYKKDSLQVKQWLCEWKLLQNKPAGYVLTRNDINWCRLKSRQIDQFETDKLFCEYNTYIQKMEETGNPDYKLTRGESYQCQIANGPFSRNPVLGQ